MGRERYERTKKSVCVFFFIYEPRYRTTKPVSTKGNNCVVSSLFHNIFPYYSTTWLREYVVMFYGSRTGNSVSEIVTTTLGRIYVLF